MQPTYSETTQDIEIKISPFFIPEQSNEEDMYHLYGYDVKITNHSPHSCQLIGREWVIRDGNKDTEYLQGEGVLGQKPTIGPGKIHQYTSFCPLQTPTGNMRGRYEFIDHKEESFWVNVPVFFFRPPSSFSLQPMEKPPYNQSL